MWLFGKTPIDSYLVDLSGLGSNICLNFESALWMIVISIIWEPKFKHTSREIKEKYVLVEYQQKFPTC